MSTLDSSSLLLQLLHCFIIPSVPPPDMCSSLPTSTTNDDSLEWVGDTIVDRSVSIIGKWKAWQGTNVLPPPDETSTVSAARRLTQSTVPCMTTTMSFRMKIPKGIQHVVILAYILFLNSAISSSIPSQTTLQTVQTQDHAWDDPPAPDSCNNLMFFRLATLLQHWPNTRYPHGKFDSIVNKSCPPIFVSWS